MHIFILNLVVTTFIPSWRRGGGDFHDRHTISSHADGEDNRGEYAESTRRLACRKEGRDGRKNGRRAGREVVTDGRTVVADGRKEGRDGRKDGQNI